MQVIIQPIFCKLMITSKHIFLNNLSYKSSITKQKDYLDIFKYFFLEMSFKNQAQITY